MASAFLENSLEILLRSILSYRSRSGCSLALKKWRLVEGLPANQNSRNKAVEEANHDFTSLMQWIWCAVSALTAETITDLKRFYLHEDKSGVELRLTETPCQFFRKPRLLLCLIENNLETHIKGIINEKVGVWMIKFHLDSWTK